jgi:hydrogenase-4 component B
VEPGGVVGILPMALVAWPFLAALLVRPLGRRSEGVRDAFVLGAVALAFLGTLALLGQVARVGPVEAGVPALVGRLEVLADPFGVFFALFTSFVWLAATLYALDYLKKDCRRDRFHQVSLVVLGAALGVVLAGNLVTLFLFFEILGLVAYLLVVHSRTREARRASRKYFWMTVGGGLVLLAGILLTFALGGEGALAPLPPDAGGPTIRWVTAGLLILGFGVKAGMLPVHVWLPDAHSVAPTPASALLSGVMIKAGAYGIFRTLTALFRPELGVEGGGGWSFSGSLGLGILWIGIATMAVGVVLALGQHNAKRLLAYHSVSQMGFILAGLGAGAYLAVDGAMGVGGGLLHASNHALFKASLFLGVGAVAFRTGELDLHRLGGLWRRMPFTFAFMLVAAAGITGVPLFNGFVSKCLIHHALVDAHEQGLLRSLAAAEMIYMATCAGTVASFLKLMGLIFLGTPERDYGPRVREAPWAMLAAMGLLSAAIVVVGVRPHLLLQGLMVPGLQVWGVPADGIDRYLERYFLGVPDLLSSGSVFLLGGVVFAAGMRWRLFDLRAPAWLGVDIWYRRGGRAVLVVFRWAGEGYEAVRLSPRQLRETRLRHALARVGRILSKTGGRVAGILPLRMREYLAGSAGMAWSRAAGRIAGGLSPWIRACLVRAKGLRERLRVPEDFDAEAGVVRTRHRIRRYARDMSVSVAVIFLLLLVLLGALVLDLVR